jgi:hypothetical protein
MKRGRELFQSRQFLTDSSKVWFDVWNVINIFDMKHMEQNYPYQQREIETIINQVENAIKNTKHVPKETELNFVIIENLLIEITRALDTPIDNLHLKINILKDEIHQLYTKLEKRVSRHDLNPTEYECALFEPQKELRV